MLKTRLIPVLLLKDGLLIRSERFSVHQFIGDPYHEVLRYNEWCVDELIYLDISRGDRYERGRHDIKIKQMANVLDLLGTISSTCFVPLTFGGRIRTLEDIRLRLSLGADKVSINTQAVDDPPFIRRAAEAYGSQCIVVCIDYRRGPDGAAKVFVEGGRRETAWEPVSWAREAQRHGAGEILLQAMDRDGTAEGFDADMVRRVADAVDIPVIALGGAGEYRHFADVVREGHAAAVAAANIFHFKELSDRYAKREMKKHRVPIREI